MTLNTRIKHRASAWSVGGLLHLLPFMLVAGTPAILRAQEVEPITAIEVIGAQKQTQETVIFKSGIKVGEDLRNLDFAKITEKMWASGSFDDIKFEVEDDKGKGGKKLVIRIRERPLIKEVDYRGGTELGLSNIKDKVKEKKLTITPDSLYDPDAARKIKDLIVDQAAEKGFRSPVVDVNLEVVGPGVARLVFEIKEGGKARVYSVKFRGNKIFSNNQLAHFMAKTRQHWSFSWLTSHDLLVDKNLEEDLKHVKEAYWRRGYKDVFVGQPTIEVQDFTSASQKKKNLKRVKEAKSPKYDLRATLVVPVLEGDQFFEGTFKVEGNDKVYKDKFFREKYAEIKRDNRSVVAKFLNIKPSTEDQPAQKAHPFDLDALNKALEKIREAYSNASYILFHAEKKLEVREDAGGNGRKLVDTTLKVEEGEPFTIRRIEFEGNTTTKDKVLRRALRLREGDAFSADQFKDSFTGLGQLGYFDVKNQEPKVDLVPNKPQVDITIKGEESGVNELLFQGGYGQLFGFTLGASFSTKNLGGGGESLALSYNGGRFSRNISVSYTEPYVLDLPYSFSASVANGSTDYDASRVGLSNAYKQFTRSLGLNTGTRLFTFFPQSRWSFFTTYSIGYSFSIIRIEGGRNFLFRDTNSQLTSSFNQGIEFNTVNHPFKPTSGTRLGMNLEYGGWQFAGDRPTLRANWNFSKYANAGERHIFAANLSYGYLRNLGKEALPLYQYYRPGGENSIRGYRYGQIGSVLPNELGIAVPVGGNKQFIANLEYQFKVADPFRFVLFYDAGNAWAPGTKVFSRDDTSYKDQFGNDIVYRNPTLVRSMGVELRFFLPISPAPLRLIWSRKLNPYPFDTEGRTDFQFSIGTTF